MYKLYFKFEVSKIIMTKLYNKFKTLNLNDILNLKMNKCSQIYFIISKIHYTHHYG